MKVKNTIVLNLCLSDTGQIVTYVTLSLCLKFAKGLQEKGENFPSEQWAYHQYKWLSLCCHPCVGSHNENMMGSKRL